MLVDYAKARWRIAALIVLWGLTGGAVFWLYDLPGEPILYAIGLWALSALALGAADFLRWRGRRRALTAQLKAIDVSLDGLPAPDNGIEADYQTLLRAAFARNAALDEANDRARAELEEYYTLWTHQIKTPIAAMRLMLQSDDGALARSLEPELFRVERYVDMALNYARLGGDASDLAVRRCGLDAVVRQAVRKFAPLFIRKKLTLNLEPLDLQVLTDEKWLGFAVEQVLSNAVKYTPAGAVTIRAEAGPVLVIEDTGIGIAPQDLPRVFERSFTGLNGRADRQATGIGLYLAKRALERLGHGIRAESEVGAGTRVYIDLREAAVDVRE
ncbi:MAG: sensor histidine kinase [Clostridia bacterium]|nr:sensor histidine kinase [Clostridia bacterium]